MTELRDIDDERPMDRAELRVWLDERFCGCGQPEEAAGALLRLLRLHPIYEHYDEFDALLPDGGIAHLLLYMFDRDELTMHGGTVGGGWLSAKGTAVRDALEREEGDGFETLLHDHCSHGFDFGDPDHDCMAADARPTEWDIDICADCGIRVESEHGNTWPVGGCPTARRCGVFTQATATTAGPVNPVREVETIRVCAR